jgi:hypothetical protein
MTTKEADLFAAACFQDGLAKLLNRYSVENESNTPDFILAEFLRGCLTTFAEATKKREKWYGVHLEPGRLPQQVQAVPHVLGSTVEPSRPLDFLHQAQAFFHRMREIVLAHAGEEVAVADNWQAGQEEHLVNLLDTAYLRGKREERERVEQAGQKPRPRSPDDILVERRYLAGLEMRLEKLEERPVMVRDRGIEKTINDLCTQGVAHAERLATLSSQIEALQKWAQSR